MCYKTKIIIHNINVVTKSDNLFSLKNYFMRIARLYICNALVNIRNVNVKYFPCGLIHFKVIFLVYTNLF